MVIMTGTPDEQTPPRTADTADLRSYIADLLSKHTLRTSEVATLLGLGSAAAARVQMRRWEIQAAGRDLPSGEKLWPTAEIKTKNENRPEPQWWPRRTDPQGE